MMDDIATLWMGLHWSPFSASEYRGTGTTVTTFWASIEVAVCWKAD